MVNSSLWEDASIQITPELPTWPGSPGVNIEYFRTLDNHPSRDTFLSMDVHSGTHVEASSHRLNKGKTLSDYSIDNFMFQVKVVDMSELLNNTVSLLRGEETAIFFRTTNSDRNLLGRKAVVSDYQAIPHHLASEVVNQGYRAVGIDYLSVDKLDSAGEAHQIFFDADMLVYESLDLREIIPGSYDCVALPLKLGQREAAPCRVLLRTGKRK